MRLLSKVGALALILSTPALAAGPGYYGSGDRMYGYSISTAAGLTWIPAVTCVDTSGNATGCTSSGSSSVTQGTSPWVDNVSQFGGSAVVTGVGASGAGIPRVTVSNDSAVIVTGNVASGSTDSGNPVKIGARAQSGIPSSTAVGNRVDALYDQFGRPGITLGMSANAGDGVANTIASPWVFNGGTASGIPVIGFNYNGSTLSEQRGDTTGMWMGGHANLATAQTSVGTTATLIAAARTGRQKIILTVTSAVQCSFGGSSVTTTTGFPLQAVAGATVTLDTAAAVYGACASTATVGDAEEY